MKEYTTIEEIAAYLDTLPDWIFDVFEEELGSKEKVAHRLYFERGDYGAQLVGTPQTEKRLESRMEQILLIFLAEACRTQIIFTAMEREDFPWPFDKSVPAHDAIEAFRAYDAVKEKAFSLWTDIDPDSPERQHLDGFFALLARLIVRRSDYQDFADAVSLTFGKEISGLQDALSAIKEASHV